MFVLLNTQDNSWFTDESHLTDWTNNLEKATSFKTKDEAYEVAKLYAPENYAVLRLTNR